MAFFAIYFILRQAKLIRQSLIAKCAGTYLAVAGAGLALCAQGKDPLTQTAFWFFVLCAVADAALELWFIPGVCLFGAAHICLIVWLFSQDVVTWVSALVWVAALAVGLVLFRRELPKMGWMAVPCSLYVGILSCTLALCLPLPFLELVGALPTAASVRLWPMAVGSLCFFISDLMVAKGELNSRGDRFQRPIMILYWLALYLFAAGLWPVNL